MVIFRMVPENGMRNCLLRIAEAAHRRGHDVTVFTTETKGEHPAYLRVITIPNLPHLYHKRVREFFRILQESFRTEKQDVTLGFNRGPGLDFYFSGGNCFVFTERQDRSGVYRLFNREYAARAALEQEVFSPGAKTKIFHFSDEQKSQFIRTFHTPENRFLQLPPAANQDCRRGGDYAERRAAMRRRFSAGESELVLVQIATNMMRKGVDRSILAVASLPEEIRARVRLCLVGRELPKLRQLVAEQHLENQVFFEGVQYKVRDYLFAADFLLHPARVEVTGPMLLEALDAGVPVLCTDLCGYAPCVVKSHAGGTVAGKAFDQMELNVSLLSFLWNPEQLRELSGYALDFMKHHDSFAYADAVVDAMEQKGTSHAAR